MSLRSSSVSFPAFAATITACYISRNFTKESGNQKSAAPPDCRHLYHHFLKDLKTKRGKMRPTSPYCVRINLEGSATPSIEASSTKFEGYHCSNQNPLPFYLLMPLAPTYLFVYLLLLLFFICFLSFFFSKKFKILLPKLEKLPWILIRVQKIHK